MTDTSINWEVDFDVTPDTIETTNKALEFARNRSGGLGASEIHKILTNRPDYSKIPELESVISDLQDKINNSSSGRTKTAEKEELYKRKTVCGIYQALSQTKSPIMIKLFYTILPIASPALLVFGKKGYFWMKGILLGLSDYLRGDRSGVWQSTYLE